MNTSTEKDDSITTPLVFAVLLMLVFFAFSAKFGWEFGKNLAADKNSAEQSN